MSSPTVYVQFHRYVVYEEQDGDRSKAVSFPHFLSDSDKTLHRMIPVRMLATFDNNSDTAVFHSDSSFEYGRRERFIIQTFEGQTLLYNPWLRSYCCVFKEICHGTMLAVNWIVVRTFPIEEDHGNQSKKKQKR